MIARRCSGPVVAAALLAAMPAVSWSASKAPTRRAATAAPAPMVAPDPPVLSPEAGRVIAWIAAARDNGSLPYAVVDKQAASLTLYDRHGVFQGQAPVLIGIGVGDDSSPGVGLKKTLAEIGPAERTTPAGRFIARFGRAFGHTRVLWVDYANSVALHAVITNHPAERRLERLRSPEADDNRITFGCINVGTAFYTRRITPLFARNGGLVYILPDTRSVDEVFPRARLLPYLAGGGADTTGASEPPLAAQRR